jgi:hypothetical protein
MGKEVHFKPQSVGKRHQKDSAQIAEIAPLAEGGGASTKHK